LPFVPLWIFFGDCLPGVEFPAETQALQVQPAIDLEKRRMHLEFTAEQWILPETVGQLCRNVAEATDCKVTHDLRFAPACFGPQAFGWLLQKLREAVAVVNGFLHTTEIAYDAPLLCLTTSETGKRALADVDAARWIQKFVRAHFDLQVDVQIGVKSEDTGIRDTEPSPVPDTWASDTPPLQAIVPPPPKDTSALPFSLENSQKIMGAAIRESPTPMEGLESSDASAVVVGEVFGLKEVRTKDGTKRIITF